MGLLKEKDIKIIVGEFAVLDGIVLCTSFQTWNHPMELLKEKVIKISAKGRSRQMRRVGWQIVLPRSNLFQPM